VFQIETAYLLISVSLVNFVLAFNVRWKVVSHQEVVSFSEASVAFQGTQELTIVVVTERSTSDKVLYAFKSWIRLKLITNPITSIC
jgi:hypothetical protein